MATSLYTALDIARCVRWDNERQTPIFDCKPEEALESFKVLRQEVLRLGGVEDEVERLSATLYRVENEAVALATENSNLRSELHALREAIKYGCDDGCAVILHDD